MLTVLPDDPTRRDWLKAATAALADAGVDSPRLSAEVLLGHVTGQSRVQLATWPERALTADQRAVLDTLLARRASGEPSAYLIGEREFFGRNFRVNTYTLIPRPETELLVQAAMDSFENDRPVQFADLGTGSGCIAVTLCAERPLWRGVAVDISPDTLAVTADNAESHHVRSRLQLLCGDFTGPLLAASSLDLLISNPPYVSAAEYRELSPEVRNFEPAQALVPDPVELHKNTSAADGLEHIACIIRAGMAALRPGGVLLIEHGWTQSAAIRVLLENNMWENVCGCKDLAGLDRFIQAKRSAVAAESVW